MTPDQRTLARHALGLPNSRLQSYRNRYSAATLTPAWDHWVAMKTAGLADLSHRGAALDHFCLTRAGADAALEAGETIDPEDFS